MSIENEMRFGRRKTKARFHPNSNMTMGPCSILTRKDLGKTLSRSLGRVRESHINKPVWLCEHGLIFEGADDDA